MQIDIKNYLKQNLQRPKELDFTDEVIEYLVNLESEVSRYKNALEVAEKALKYYNNKGKHITDEEYDNYKDHGFCKSKTAGVVVDHRIARDALQSTDTITKDTKDK